MTSETSPITSAALAALGVDRAAREAQAQAERDRLVAAAVAAVEALPAPPDGSTPLQGIGLTVEHVDVAELLVVLSDGAVSLGVTVGEPCVVRLVERVDGGWTSRSGPVRSLVDLGEAIAAAG